MKKSFFELNCYVVHSSKCHYFLVTGCNSNQYHTFFQFLESKLSPIRERTFGLASWGTVSPSFFHFGILACTTARFLTFSKNYFIWQYLPNLALAYTRARFGPPQLLLRLPIPSPFWHSLLHEDAISDFFEQSSDFARTVLGTVAGLR